MLAAKNSKNSQRCRSGAPLGLPHAGTSFKRERSLDKMCQGHQCETVKNLTVSLDDETYRRARTIAAQRDTSVSALVKGFLLELTSAESKTERLKREERALRESIVDFDASDRLSRDDVYRRGA